MLTVNKEDEDEEGEEEEEAVWSGGAGMLTVHLSSLHWAAAANSHHSANSHRPSLRAHAHNFFLALFPSSYFFIGLFLKIYFSFWTISKNLLFHNTTYVNLEI